jgi:hypothetical protein
MPPTSAVLRAFRPVCVIKQGQLPFMRMADALPPGAWRQIEPRPKGRPEGSPVDDYVVEDHADHVLETFKTQIEAIDWAKSQGHAP